MSNLGFVYFFWICPADASNPHRRHARRQTPRKSSAVKDKNRSILDPDIFLDLVKSITPPEGAYLVRSTINYYITVTGKCIDKLNSVHPISVQQYFPDQKNQPRKFLVNKNDFEMLEWTTLADINSDQTPVWLCKDNYISKDTSGKVALKKKEKVTPNDEVLTLNNGIQWQDLKIDSNKVPGKQHVEVIKKFMAFNKNCDPAKYVMKLDGGTDKSRSSQKGSSHSFGVGLEGSVSGTTPTLINLGGKLNLKYDYSRSKSITITDVDKVMHSVSVEVLVPPKHSCTVEITSTTFKHQGQFTGQLTRKYNNGYESKTSVTDINVYWEISDLEASVDLCTPIKGAEKCSKPSNLHN